MVVEEFPSFLNWFLIGIPTLLAIIFALLLIGMVIGYLISAARRGPTEGFYVMAKVMASAVPDFVHTSPRRVLAMTRLTIQESIRRRVLLAAFALFAGALLFGGWFLDVTSDHPDRLYITFVMWGTQILVLLLVLLLASFSLPNDIKNKTIYTVVTKPVRASEIVLGRTLGFAVLGTFILSVMAVISYFFVVRGLNHRHAITAADFVDTSVVTDAGDDGAVIRGSTWEGTTTMVSGHRHTVTVTREGQAFTDTAMGHTHPVYLTFDVDGQWQFTFRTASGETKEFTAQVRGSGGGVSVTASGDDPISLENVSLNGAQFRATMPASMLGTDEDVQLIAVLAMPQPDVDRLTMSGEVRAEDDKAADFSAQQVDREGDGQLVTIELGPPQGMLLARVPIYGRLHFLDRSGKIKLRGISVGNEWTYRSYIRGGSLAAAIWKFEGISPGHLRGGQLPLEMTLSVYRTYKGDIEQGVMGEVVLKHPDRPTQSAPRVFVSREYETLRLGIPQKLEGQDRSGKVRELDLFEDLVDEDGQIEVRVQCADPQQYFGVAQADVYVRGRDNSFVMNFFKGYFSIWMQMIIVICIGVMFSTFLNPAVTLLATSAFTSVGFFNKFISELTSQDWWGGGPVESLVRIITQKNLVLELEPGTGTTLMRLFDYSMLWMLEKATYAIPDWNRFQTSRYVAYGFDIGIDLVSIHFVSTVLFFIGLTIVAYFLLKTREIAA